MFPYMLMVSLSNHEPCSRLVPPPSVKLRRTAIAQSAKAGRLAQDERCAEASRGRPQLRAAVAVIGLCACLVASCGRSADPTPTLAVQPPPVAASAAADGTVPHGDHNPHFGGIVLMNGDLHFEVVAGKNGVCRVYFSDATRAELPAATASEVTVTVSQKGQAPDVVALHIDDSGESWIGRGRPIEDPAANLRVAYTSHGKPYFIDVPFPR